MPFATLPSKPDAPLAYNQVGEGDQLIVFINGLGLPAASWSSAISMIQESSSHPPRMLTYDRYGQGATDAKDPLDNLPGKEAGYGHDIQDAVNDLRELLQVLAPAALHHLVFVAASIGVHIARLYAAQHPGTVDGFLLLDSNMATLDFSDIWPNPDTPEFKESEVISEDCSIAVYREAYTKLCKMFNANVKNPENLDRRSVKQLLPDPSTPMLKGSENKGPWITVVGHDPKQFAEESLNTMGTPKTLTYKYTQPAWEAYNEGLLKLTTEDRCTGVIFAPGCGHFIQRDNPTFVATQVNELLERVKRT